VTGHGEPRSSPLAVRIAPGPGAYRSDGARLWPVPLFYEAGLPSGKSAKRSCRHGTLPAGPGKGTFLFPKNTGDLRPYAVMGRNTCSDSRIFHFIIKALLQGLPTGICHTARDTTGMCEAGFCSGPLYRERELCTKFPVYPGPVAGDENKWKKPHRKDGTVSREEYTGQHSSALPSRKQAAAGRPLGDRHRRQCSMSDI